LFFSSSFDAKAEIKPKLQFDFFLGDGGSLLTASGEVTNGILKCKFVLRRADLRYLGYPLLRIDNCL